MEPVQIVSALRKHAPLALAHIILGAIIGLTIALLSPPVYSSQAKALVAAEGGDGTRSVSSASSVITTIMPTLVEIGTSQSVVDQVAASTGIERSKVAGAVTLSTPTSSLIIDVTARATSTAPRCRPRRRAPRAPATPSSGRSPGRFSVW